MKTADSSRSRYCGRPLSVLRVMAGSGKCQPKPKAPLPAPGSYERESCGPKSERPGLVAMGTVMEPVPVTGLAANFSPMLRIAPPPLGRLIVGAEGARLSSLPAFPVDSLGVLVNTNRAQLYLSAQGLCGMPEWGTKA